MSHLFKFDDDDDGDYPIYPPLPPPRTIGSVIVDLFEHALFSFVGVAVCEFATRAFRGGKDSQDVHEAHIDEEALKDFIKEEVHKELHEMVKNEIQAQEEDEVKDEQPKPDKPKSKRKKV